MMNFETFRATVFLRTFGFFKIPLIFFVSPKVKELSKEHCRVTIPLNRRTKNHLGSMYFGVLCTGADIAGGLLAMRLIEEGGSKVGLVFKDFKAEFLKRPEADVDFYSADGAKCEALVNRAMSSTERVEELVEIVATCPKKFGAEPVAKFWLTISLKKKK